MRGLFEKIAFWFHEIFAVKFEFILKPCCLGCLGCLGYLALHGMFYNVLEHSAPLYKPTQTPQNS